MSAAQESGAPLPGAFEPLTRRMRIVRREEIPAIRSVVVEGVEHNLGILKDFRSHPELARFLPEDARLALSWVHLEPSEALAEHVHPVDSMIVVGAGQGRTTGDLEESFGDGDIVLLPSGCLHGFVGAGESGLWALSIQFNERGLYEDPSAALVGFGDAQKFAADDEEPSFERLLARNRQYCDQHRNNSLFALVRSGRLDDAQCRRRFLDAVQVWSNWFQKAVLARSALTDDPRFSPLYRDHLDEEYGHDTRLSADRNGRPETWDPVLEATSSWFAWKMLSLDNLEKIVLVHLVLEGAGAVFLPVVQPIIDSFHETTYFTLHKQADAGHATSADSYLAGHSVPTYRRLLRVQREGWDMFNVLCSRMATLAGGITQ